MTPSRLPPLEHRFQSHARSAGLALVLACMTCPGVLPALQEPVERPALVLLVTLDTTRADEIGSETSVTPHLDQIARRGVRFSEALSPAPLTLPAHASILTGRLPPAHGLRENGTRSLPQEIPTLAESFSRAGWRTLAVVGSRILDRRFGLARGFEQYDDVISSHVLGEYGEAERSAADVVRVALGLLAQPDSRPTFLWVHVYDPHRPYRAPDSRARTARDRYREEIAFVDREIGKLLAKLTPRDHVVVLGDHGEAFGEHGEHGHGVLLQDAVLRVPLLLSGPGVPQGHVRGVPVSTHRVANTLLRLRGLDALSGSSPPLRLQGASEDAGLLYAETWLPWRVYGWSPVQVLTQGSWRLRIASGAGLFNRHADPEERHDLSKESPGLFRRLIAEWETIRREAITAGGDPVVDAEMAQVLNTLGYTARSGAGSRTRPDLPASDLPDPRAALPSLDALERAKAATRAGRPDRAFETLRQLAQDQSDNLPIRFALSNALRSLGRLEEAQRAADDLQDREPRNPAYALLSAEIARDRGQIEVAARHWQRTLALDSRQSSAWLGLAEAAARAGDPTSEKHLLEDAIEARAESAPVHLRLAQILAPSKAPHASLQLALDHVDAAIRLLPDWPLAYLERGRLSRDLGRTGDAREAYRRILDLAPGTELARRAGEELARLSATTP